MVKTAIEYNDGPIALRYPRGNGLGVPMDSSLKTLPIGSWEVLQRGTDAVILTFGTTIPMALHAAEELRAGGINAEVVNARFIKPMDTEMLHSIFGRKVPVITLEEAVLQGGFGSGVLEFAEENEYTGAIVHRLGIPDQFIEHGDVAELMDEIHLNSDEVVRVAKKLVAAQKAESNVL